MIRSGMTENQRESFRIEADSDLQAELFHEGRVEPCRLRNLSAGGAKVTSNLQMLPGTHCTLGVRLGTKLRVSGTIPYVSFLMDVLETHPSEGGTTEYRLRSMTAPGSTEYEAAAKLVFAAQQRALARSSGSDESSPMVSDPKRRSKLRSIRRPRFTKRSMRPGSGD